MYHISRIDSLTHIFQEAMPTGKLAKWKMLLSEFNIMYVNQNEIKGKALKDHLSENLIDN